MFVTEEEATTKWCPELRLEGSNVSLMKTDDIVHNFVKCVASECMMWRKDKVINKGYCGKGGKP
jgi:hypothetical protein